MNKQNAKMALLGSVFIGAIVIIISMIFLKPILQQLGALPSVIPYAISYTSIYIVFSIFNVFNVTMNNIVSSEGAAKTAMCALLAGAVLNVILDPIFIYSLEFGITGAAIATAISQIVSTVVYLIYILRKNSMFSFSIKEYSFTVVFGMTAAFLSNGIMAQFTKDDMEMIGIGQIALRANGISFILFGVYTVYSFLFLVMGKAKEGCFLGACRQGICFIPAILILPKLMGLNGILFAQPVANVLSAMIAVFMAFHLHKELKQHRC